MCRHKIAGRRDHSHVEARQFLGKGRHEAIFAICPTILDHDILPLDEPLRGKSLSKRFCIEGIAVG